MGVEKMNFKILDMLNAVRLLDVCTLNDSELLTSLRRSSKTNLDNN